jgi:hypothetical protein
LESYADDTAGHKVILYRVAIGGGETDAHEEGLHATIQDLNIVNINHMDASLSTLGPWTIDYVTFTV